jgi:hypothetical protein
VTEDGSGAVWIVDQEGQVAVMHKPFDANSAFLPVRKIRLLAPPLALYTDDRGLVWLSSSDGRIDELTGEHAATLQNGGAACARRNHVCPMAVRSFAQRSAGGLWLGTFAQGVWRMSSQGQLEQTLPAPLINNEAVLSLIEDDAGVLWLATAQGLFRFDGTRVKRMTAADGLPATPVTALVQDGAGRVWGAGPAGFFCVYEQPLGTPLTTAPLTTFINFGLEDGLVNETFAAFGAGAARSRDGRLWLASHNGLVALEAPEDLPAPRTPRVVIESVEGEGLPLRAVVAEDERIEVPGDNVRIHFTAPAFDEPHRVRLRYRVGRKPGGWVDAGSSRFAHLVALPPGNIVFEAQASRIDRPGEVETARVRLLVSRRYLGRPTLYLCAAALVVALAWVFRGRATKAA